MASLFGVQSKGGTRVSGGGNSSLWNWGVSPFDQSAIDSALATNKTAMTNRYTQLGMGGSTPEGQDLGTVPSVVGGLPMEASAVTGQEQTANVGNAALNPALQSPVNELLGATPSGQLDSTLASLAGKALTAGATLGA